MARGGSNVAIRSHPHVRSVTLWPARGAAKYLCRVIPEMFPDIPSLTIGEMHQLQLCNYKRQEFQTNQVQCGPFLTVKTRKEFEVCSNDKYVKTQSSELN